MNALAHKKLFSEFLRDTWYVAMWSHELMPGAVVARTILDEPIVF